MSKILRKNFWLFLLMTCFLVVSTASVESARLPIVGGDDNNWGNILNDFLNISLNGSGYLRSSRVVDSLNSQNLSIGEKLIFSNGAIISNLINSILELNSNVNVTKNMTVNGTLLVSGNHLLKVKEIQSTDLNIFTIKAAQATLALEDPFQVNFYQGTSTLDATTQMFSVNGEDGIIFIGSPSKAMGFTMYTGDGNWAHTLLNFDPTADAISYFGSTSQDNTFIFRSSNGNELEINGPDHEVKVGSNAILKANTIMVNPPISNDMYIKAAQGTLAVEDPQQLNFYESTSTLDDTTRLFSVNGEDDIIFIGAPSKAMGFTMYTGDGNWAHTLLNFDPTADAISYFGSTSQDNTFIFRSSNGNELEINGPDHEVKVGSNAILKANTITANPITNDLLLKAAQATLEMADPHQFNFYQGTSTLDDTTQMFSVNGEDGIIFIGSPSKAMGFTMYTGDGNWAHTLLNFDPTADAISYFGSTSQDNTFIFRSSNGDLLTINGSDEEVRVTADFYVPTKSTPSSCTASSKGGIYFDTGDNHFYGCNGSSWVRLDN